MYLANNARSASTQDVWQVKIGLEMGKGSQWAAVRKGEYGKDDSYSAPRGARRRRHRDICPSCTAARSTGFHPRREALSRGG